MNSTPVERSIEENLFDLFTQFNFNTKAVEVNTVVRF